MRPSRGSNSSSLMALLARLLPRHQCLAQKGCADSSLAVSQRHCLYLAFRFSPPLPATDLLQKTLAVWPSGPDKQGSRGKEHGSDAIRAPPPTSVHSCHSHELHEGFIGVPCVLC